jgi:hypothetical protein
MSNLNQHADRGADGRLLRKFRRPPYPQSTPGWWTKLHMTRPKRRENARVCLLVLKGDDPDGLTFPLGNRKPHEYYW